MTVGHSDLRPICTELHQQVVRQRVYVSG
jgi:hypothetical protein